MHFYRASAPHHSAERHHTASSWRCDSRVILSTGVLLRSTRRSRTAAASRTWGTHFFRPQHSSSSRSPTSLCCVGSRGCRVTRWQRRCFVLLCGMRSTTLDTTRPTSSRAR
eukprot:6704536-Prymnesium_polylepis.4